MLLTIYCFNPCRRRVNKCGTCASFSSHHACAPMKPLALFFITLPASPDLPCTMMLGHLSRGDRFPCQCFRGAPATFRLLLVRDTLRYITAPHTAYRPLLTQRLMYCHVPQRASVSLQLCYIQPDWWRVWWRNRLLHGSACVCARINVVH